MKLDSSPILRIAYPKSFVAFVHESATRNKRREACGKSACILSHCLSLQWRRTEIEKPSAKRVEARLYNAGAMP